ncbi:MAG: hypothetical protein OH316_01005 [Candidatus Parvarchaeota archaeon]|nr:hypothetical protein [Candidatus Parvarchaeota archaeon]MCW1301700.1 hypothetical protein [Candidatus Parvarchaeota archaeon]
MSIENYSYLKELAMGGLRLDQRGPFQRRKITLRTKVSNHADGSAYVELGETKVIAGVKVLPGEPYPDRPDEGSLNVNFEASELSSNYPADRIIYSVEVGRVTDRAIRESKFIDMKKLCITPGSKVLFVFIDIYAINNGGNLLDAANIAALAAILDANYKVEGKEETFKLPFNLDNMPISSTFVKIGDAIFLDANSLEENISDARLSIGVSRGINSMQKGGTGYFKEEEIERCVDEAFRYKEEIKDMLIGKTER